MRVPASRDPRKQCPRAAVLYAANDHRFYVAIPGNIYAKRSAQIDGGMHNRDMRFSKRGDSAECLVNHGSKLVDKAQPGEEIPVGVLDKPDESG